MSVSEWPPEVWTVVLRNTQLFDWLHAASGAALVYYYATTFDQEVEWIWSQPKRRVGRNLFLLSRYANIGTIIVRNVHNNWRTGVPFSVYTCHVLDKVMWALNVIGVSVVPEMIFWLCLFALLGGKRWHLITMVILFTAFMIPIQVLQGIFIATRKGADPGPVYKELGFSCVYDMPERFDLYTAAGYLAFARTTLVMIVAIITLFVRYRKQNNSLIKVIRYEGGAYYVSAFILSFFGSLANMPNTPLPDRYQLIPPMRLLLIPVFADRLLLQMQTVNDPGTRAVITTLMFDHRTEAADTISTEDEFGNDTVPPEIMAMEDDSVEMQQRLDKPADEEKAEVMVEKRT